MAYEEYLKAIDEEAARITAASDEVWEAAELAFSEHKSAACLTKLLEEEGFEVQCPAYGIETAFTGSFGSGKPVIGFLGEFDALGSLSQKAGVAVKEALIPGANGHGCGHNMLGAGSIAAAVAVKRYLEKTGKSGTVIYFGCPGEEGGSGKAFMAREGAFSGLDFAITWHPGEMNAVSAGSSLANIQVLYKFYGVSSHAAGSPELGRSALDAVELMNVGVNFLREHMISDARIHYAILNTGGISPNVVQPYAEVLYLIRAPKVGQVQELFARVNKIAEGMAMATETRMEYEIIKACSNVINNAVMEKELYKALKETPLPEYTAEEYAFAEEIKKTSDTSMSKPVERTIENYLHEENKKYMEERAGKALADYVVPYEEDHIIKVGAGSTDVGDVSWMCPTAQIGAATWAANSGGHSWQVVAQGKSSIAHKGLLYAGKVMASAAIHMMENPEIIEAAKKEYTKKLEGQTYVPIPADVKPRPIDKLSR